MTKSNATQQNLPAPCTLLMRRKFRKNLPVKTELLTPNYSTKDVLSRFDYNQNLQKQYYDRSTKKLPELEVNEPILMQEGKRRWNPGVVTEKLGHNDYVVEVNEGEYRRNRYHLRPLNTEQPFSIQEPTDVPIKEEIETSIKNYYDGYITKSGRISRPPNRLNM